MDPSDKNGGEALKRQSAIDMIGDEIHITAVDDANIVSEANRHGRAKLPERQKGFAINVSRLSKLAAPVPRVLNAKK